MITAHWLNDPWALTGTLIGLAVFALVVVGLVALLRSTPGPSPHSSSAVRLLEQRYARGEIDRDEFLERRRVLSAQPPADEP